MLDALSPRPGARHRTKRVGRGPGSGHRKTSGRGIKGQGKRSPGRETPFHFEGGQMPLVRRLPKRGFRSLNPTEYQVINLGALVPFGDGATVDVDLLVAHGLARARGGLVKLLGEGIPPRNVTVRLHKASEGAKRKLAEAGGRWEPLA
jgi:large subunit ribosomal protein L15